MPKRRFRAEDALRLKLAADPDLSPDGRRIAFAVVDTDEETDRLCWSIWVAASDGATPPRRFTEGPADRSPRFSPDGRWLAYISTPDGHPDQAHVRLASLDGGVPARLGKLPGPVTQLAWSPDSRRIAVVSRVGGPGEELSAKERNAPRLVRGLGARRDGVGWYDGRQHLFVVEVEDGSTRQVTRGEFDHSDPSFSPDGTTLACASDRSARRDDRQFRSDLWVFPLSGGRPRRLTNGRGRVVFPRFSPGGRLIAFTGQVTSNWDEDPHLFVVPSDGSGQPEAVVAELDRPVPLFPGAPAPHAWTSERELTLLIADHGAFALHRARVGDRRTRELVGGDVQVDGFAARPGHRAVAYTASWPDRPSELFATAGGGESVQISHLNDEFLDEVALSAVKRSTITRPDGTEIEYFTLLPPGREGRRAPLHLEIHGGPHASWPSGRWLAFHQAIAAAGYCVLLPNPRGSSSYGQQFTAACTGDWGGADREDILACCDDLIELGIADGERMFVSGGSYGGFMTAWIAGHCDRFRAGTAVAAVIEQTSMALTTDVPDFAMFNMGGTPWERPDEYELRSPLRYLPAVQTPLLVIHWEGDIRVPVGQGEELYTGLRVLGKEAEFLRYPGGFHILRTPSQAVDMTRQVLEWNRRHDRRRGGRATSGRRRARTSH